MELWGYREAPNNLKDYFAAVRCAFFVFMQSNPTPEQGGSSGIQLFTNPTFGSIRTAGTPENPVFCLTDLCKVLDLDSSQVMKRLEDGVVCIHPTPDSLGRVRKTNFVNEDGLYDVILDSRKPEAKQFRKWITSDVLPQIRKTGGYIHTEEDDSEADIMAKALMIAQRTIDAKAQRIQMLEGERDALQEENKALAPKAQYTDNVLQSTNTYTFTEIAKEMGMTSAKKLIAILRQDHIIFQQGERYLPYAKYSNQGFFKSRTHHFFHSDGRPDSSAITVVTEKGRMMLHSHMCKKVEANS